MALSIVKEIELSSHDINPDPKLVDQLYIIHESSDGELVQYYITRDTHVESDKNTYAVGIPKRDSVGNITGWTYITYEDAVWNNPKGRITRQRIDRLGVKAFPQIGAIAFYKLAYRNLSRVVAPVNFNKNRQYAPTLQATPSADRTSVTFTMTDPTDPSTGEPVIEYIAYRIIMVVDVHQLEFVTYEKEYTVANVPITANYLCYVIGYINEGEICSYESNHIEVPLIGLYAQWQSISPGYGLSYTLSRNGQNIRLNDSKGGMTTASIDATDIVVTLSSSGWDAATHLQTVQSADILGTSIVEVLPILVVNSSDVDNNELLNSCGIYESYHTAGAITFFAKVIPSIDVSIRIRIR